MAYGISSSPSSSSSSSPSSFFYYKQVPGVKEVGVLHTHDHGMHFSQHISILSILEKLYLTGPEAQRFELEIHLGRKLWPEISNKNSKELWGRAFSKADSILSFKRQGGTTWWFNQEWEFDKLALPLSHPVEHLHLAGISVPPSSLGVECCPEVCPTDKDNWVSPHLSLLVETKLTGQHPSVFSFCMNLPELIIGTVTGEKNLHYLLRKSNTKQEKTHI